AHRDLALVLNQLGHSREALAECDAALALASEGDVAEAHNNKGVVFESLGLFGDAASSYQKAVDLEPRQFDYRRNLAYALHENHRTGDAEREYMVASRLRPNWPELAMEDAWHLATSPHPTERDGKQALRKAKQVIQATGSRHSRAPDVLAAAY